jgi:ABC-type transporter Mla subunit MlaD
MAEPGRTDPFADVISLVAGPIAAVIRSFDQLRKGADELMKGLENFNATMVTLNETAGRVNRLLNDIEEPVRAMVPQITRTVKLADDMATRLSGPVDEVVPGLRRLADTLDSPVLRDLPTDLGQFLEVLNDLRRRIGPLAQLAEQAGGLFGLRLPGFGAPSPAPDTAAPAAGGSASDDSPEPSSTAASEPTPSPAAEATRPAKRPAKKSAARKTTPRERG